MRSPRYLVPMIVACALFMENMDATVIATALPTIAHAFGESPLRLNLAITAYLLSLGIFIPLSAGPPTGSARAHGVQLGDRRFTLGSIPRARPCSRCLSWWPRESCRNGRRDDGACRTLCRAANDPEVGARLGDGLPGPCGADRPVLGPPLGGFIVTYTSWRWIFAINIPIGCSVSRSTRASSRTCASGEERLDLAGFGS
jgi:hypothetical protein